MGHTPITEFGHTSYKGNGQFILPPLQNPPPADKGKGREFHRPTQPSTVSNLLFMGPSTPWKSSTQFLNPPGSKRNPVPGITPPDVGVEPNVLRGLGSINTGIWGEAGLPTDGRLNQSQITQLRDSNLEARNDRENPQGNEGNSPRNNKRSQPPRRENSPSPNGNFPTGNGGGNSGGGGGSGNNPYSGGGDYPSPGGGGSPFPSGGGGGNPFPGGGNNPWPGGSGDPFPGGGHGPPGGGGDPFPGGGGGGGYPDPAIPAGAVIPNDESDLREYIPYGTNVPTIKAELKHENLPSWDGNHDTAIEYFWKVQQLASLGGWIPQALGYWLWNSLKPGSKVQVWFATLTGSEQARMRSHYIHYLRGIKELFLGKKWQMQMNVVFESQAFRQPGHECEAPSTFITRRIMYTRMLVAVEEGSPVEVFIIMQKAPISWGPIIVLETVKNTSMLYSRVTEHEAALSLAAKQETSNVLTAENVVPVLRRMGYYLDRQRGTIDRRAHLGVTPQGESKWVPEKRAYISELDDTIPDTNNTQDILKEAYQALGIRQRPPPKDGYPYPKNDHVTTKMGRLPPSPCKTCGSKNHWDKECPDWAISQVKLGKTALLNEATDEDTETEMMYQSAFSVLISERLASEKAHLDKLNNQDFESAVLLTLANQRTERKTGEGITHVTTPKVTVEEVEDESWAALRKLPKSTHYIMEETELKAVDEIKDPPETPASKVSMEEVEDEFWQEYYKLPKSPHHVLDDNWSDEEVLKESNFTKAQNQDEPLSENLPHHLPPMEPPPTNHGKPIRLLRKRFRPDGASAVGVSVLAVKGWVGSKENDRIDLRLDSCADITLLSEEYYRTLRDKPPLRAGMKLRLWQLTDKDSSIQGFVKIPITMIGEDGELFEAEAEAYVVPGMTVPILLGEDFQLTYELGVTRNVEEGTYVHFGQTNYKVRAQAVERTKDFDRLRQSAMAVGHFVRAKLHRRNKAKRHRKKVKFGVDQTIVRAAEDFKLRPHEFRPIRVEGQLGEDKEWFVEKNLLANANNSFFAVPNVLISARSPWIPIANPTNHPRFIRKGEAIGIIKDPAEFFDTPRNEEWDKLAASATVLEKLIAIQTDTEQKHGDTHSEEEEYGPKTAAMPDPTIYPSTLLEELIDVGSLPENLKKKAWEMLRRREKAFGFDGRLGHLDTKVHIRTVDGQVPISGPMYGSSPEKQKIIEAQLDKWFEQGVIEASRSPWSAPVVIAY